MHRVAFKMKLYEGCAAEYKKRHTEIWPNLAKLLKRAGVRDYSIYLDEETSILFASLKITDKKNLDTLPALDVMQKWWAFMDDMMETHPDKSPVIYPLTEVFYLD